MGEVDCGGGGGGCMIAYCMKSIIYKMSSVV